MLLQMVLGCYRGFYTVTEGLGAVMEGLGAVTEGLGAITEGRCYSAQKWVTGNL